MYLGRKSRGVVGPYNYCNESEIVIDQCASCWGVWICAKQIFEISRYIRIYNANKDVLLHGSRDKSLNGAGGESDMVEAGAHAFVDAIIELLVGLFG